MNPFENGVVDPNALHGVMTKAIASRQSRTVMGENFPFFYNPMWAFFGDATPGPPGTYYREGHGDTAYFWNMFDQVLVRPDLLPAFENHGVFILDSDGSQSVLTSEGIPNSVDYSDHLPILLSLNL